MDRVRRGPHRSRGAAPTVVHGERLLPGAGAPNGHGGVVLDSGHAPSP